MQVDFVYKDGSSNLIKSAEEAQDDDVLDEHISAYLFGVGTDVLEGIREPNLIDAEGALRHRRMGGAVQISQHAGE